MGEETKETKKLSYEQLENVAHQLSEQSKKLYEKLQEVNMTNVFKRLDYLFKVIEAGDTLLSTEFVKKCAKEIEDLMTVEEKEEVKKAEEDSTEKTE